MLAPRYLSQERAGEVHLLGGCAGEILRGGSLNGWFFSVLDEPVKQSFVFAVKFTLHGLLDATAIKVGL